MVVLPAGHQGQSEGVVRTKGAQASQRALPAASRPTISIRISFLLKSLAKSRLKVSPMAAVMQGQKKVLQVAESRSDLNRVNFGIPAAGECPC